MEENEPETYQCIVSSDKESQKRFSGHGSAIGQAYNHMILPLANSREKIQDNTSADVDPYLRPDARAAHRRTAVPYFRRDTRAAHRRTAITRPISLHQ